MGIDLALIPLSEPSELTCTRIRLYDRTQLRLNRDYNVFGQIMAELQDEPVPVIHSEPLPPQLWLAFPNGDGEEIVSRTEPKNNTPITFAYVKELKKLNVSNSSAVNQAALAYLNILPDTTPVIIMWE